MPDQTGGAPVDRRSRTRRRIPLDSPLGLGRLTEHPRDGGTLFIDAERAVWITLDDREAPLLRRLRGETTVRQAMRGLAAPERDTMVGVMGRLARAGFLAELPARPPVTPRRVQIHLTNRCNLTCTHCYMDSAVNLTPETELAAWLDLLDELAARYPLIHVSFSGGEPLMSASLIPLLRRVRELADRGTARFSTAMITNGLLLRGSRLEKVAPLLDVCAISLDGISAETHDRIRGPRAFERTYRSLLGLAGTPFRKVLNITVLRHNREELTRDLRGFLDGLPFRPDVDLGTLVPEGRGTDVFDLGLPPDEFRAALAGITASLFRPPAAEAPPVPGVVTSPTVADGSPAAEPLVGVDGSALWADAPRRAQRSCGYGDTLSVYSNGDVSTCLTPRFIRGNVFRDGVATLIDRIDRERELFDVDRMEECRVCDLRHICGGRCHLGQLRGGGPLGQVACSDRYKQSFYDNLVAWSSSG